MKTVREAFREGIATGDWELIRATFTALTGERAPEPPAIEIEDPLDRPMGKINRAFPANPLDAPIHSAYPDNDDEELDKVEDMLVDDTVAPDVIPATEEPVDDPVAEFRIQQGDPQPNGPDEDGRTFCHRQKMNIPKVRPNKFQDNGTAFASERIDTNPNDGKSVETALGITKVRPRDFKIDDDTLRSQDTSKKTKVQCGLCDKWEEISPSLSRGYSADPDNNRYRCNKCSSPTGRGAVRKHDNMPPARRGRTV